MKRQTNRQKKIIVTSIIIVIAIAIDFTLTGFLRFGYNVAQCGKLPVKITTTTFGGGYTWYDLPGQYNPGGVIRVRYVCSEEEAVHERIPKGI